MLSSERENLQKFYAVRRFVDSFLESLYFWIETDSELSDNFKDYNNYKCWLEEVSFLREHRLDAISAYTINKLNKEQSYNIKARDYDELVDGNPDFISDCYECFLDDDCPDCIYDAKTDSVTILKENSSTMVDIKKEAVEIAKGASGKSVGRDVEVR